MKITGNPSPVLPGAKPRNCQLSLRFPPNPCLSVIAQIGEIHSATVEKSQCVSLAFSGAIDVRGVQKGSQLIQLVTVTQCELAKKRTGKWHATRCSVIMVRWEVGIAGFNANWEAVD